MATTEKVKEVLASHGYDVVGKTLGQVWDDARAAGLVYACLGCGSIGGIDPANLAGHPDAETARRATRDAFDFTCCAEDTTVLF